MKNKFLSKSVPRGTRTIWRYLSALFLLFTLGIGQMWADLTAHVPGVYEKTVATGGYGCTLTTVASGENAGTFEVYYFSAQSKYSENTTVYNGGTKQQYRLMCTDSDSEYQLINTNGTSAFTASCDWIEMAYTVTGFSKSDYTFGSNKFNEFFEITPNGGNTGITKTCYIKPKEGDVLTLKVSGYVEFAILGNDNGSSKYMTVAVDGGTPTSWKSNTLSRRSVTLTTGEHTIVVANVGNSANAFYGFSLKLPSCAAGAPGNISKGTLSAGVLTLNAAGSAASGDTWYWQSSATGTDKTNSGSSFDVSAAGTYYIRSYNTADDCWSNAKSITISATDLVANYTVKYMDGTTELGSEIVAVGDHPAGIADPTKDCYTFTGWMNGSTPVADATALSGTADEEIELTATWTPVYSSSATLISDENVSAKANVNTIFAASNIVSSITFTSGNYEFTSNVTKPGYYGYKDKQSGDYMKIMLQQGKRVQVLFGNLGADPTITVNGAAQSLDASRATGDNAENTFTYTATAADALIVITMGSGTNTLKKVDINALFSATYTDGTGDASGSASDVAEVTLPTPTETTVGGNTFTGWTANKVVYDGETEKAVGAALEAGKTYKLTDNTVFTAQWQLISDFNVKFFQGYGDPDVQIGATQVISTGEYATAPTDPERAGFAFLGWSYDATEAHIVDVATYGITAATNFTAMWKAVWTVTFDGAGNVEVQDGETVASPNSPVMAGKIFQGWYNGEDKYDFSAAVTGNLALTSKWADADANHYVYAYNDDFHFDGVVYKTPEGAVDAGSGTSNIAMTTPYTLFEGAEGITSIVMTDGIYDSKTGAIQAVTALMKVNNNSKSKLTVTIKSGYTATLKIKSSGYSATRTINVSDATPASGTTTGQAVTSGAMSVSGIGELSFALTSGSHDLTVTGGTLYIAELDIEATALPTYSVTYLPNDGSATQVVDANTYYAGDEVTLMANPFTAPTGKIWSEWSVKDGNDDDVAVTSGKFTMPSSDVTATAVWVDDNGMARLYRSDDTEDANSPYETLVEAVAAAQVGDKIVLQRNVLDGAGIMLTKDDHKTLTIDFGGYTYTAVSPGVGSTGTQNQAFHLEKGNTVTLKNGTITSSGSVILMLVQNYCDLTLENITLNGSNLPGTHAYVLSNNCGDVVVGAGTTITAKTGDVAFDVCATNYYPEGVNVTVQAGATISGIVEYDVWGTKPANNQATLAIEGGDFDITWNVESALAEDAKENLNVSAGSFSAAVPVEYCAEGYIPAPQDTETGKYTVKEGWKVTFVDGEDEEIVAVDKNTPVAEKAMAGKIGYTFNGWFNGADLYDFTANVTSDMMLNAQWTAFAGCADLWPATSGAALNVGDNVDLQTGSAGGSIAVVGMKTAESTIAYNANGLFLSGGGADVISVTLNNDMAADTKISVTLMAAGNGDRGLNLLNATGGKVKGGTKLGWDEVAAGVVATFSYVVEAGDGLEGTNIFRLQRNNSVYLQSVRVESCGDAIIYHNLTSAVVPAGKGTVALGASSVRENHTTTAEYTITDPLYEFVSWSVSGAGASVENATANPATITVGTEDAVVTLNLQLIPVKFTVNYYDGTTPMGTEEVAVNENPTASEINTIKRHYTFQGWAETDGGSVVALNTITRTEATTVNLYAVYAPVACPTEGTVFSMEFDSEKVPSSTVKVAKNGGSLDLADYATLVGGNAAIENNETSDKDAITTSGQFKLTATKEVMKIELECAIATGDVIRIPDNNAKYVLSTSNAKTGTYQAQTSSQHDFEATAAWNGVDDLYILYDGSSLSFTKVYVLRPYTISFDLQGHGDAIDAQKLVEGKKVEEPTAPTADGWDFIGWYKEAACTNAWDFDNDVVEGTMSLFAKWTEHVTNDATLKSLKYGSTAITLVDGTYEYNVELAAAVATVPALSAETNAALATKEITNATEFVAGQASSTVLVTAEDGATQLLYTVNFTKEAAIELQDVTGDMTWDFSKANGGSTAGSNLCNDEVLANVAGIVNNSDFESDNIKATANKFAGTKLQASMIKFHTTVDGMITVVFSNTGNKSSDRYLTVNGRKTDKGSKNQTAVTFRGYVPAGDVELGVVEGDGNMLNFTSVAFKATYELQRTDSWIAPGELGTVCYPNGYVAGGAEIYEMAGVDENGKFVFDEVFEMMPGKPYLFRATSNGPINFYQTPEEEVGAPDNSGSMKGTFTDMWLSPSQENLYYFIGTHFYAVSKRSSDIKVPAYRCYVDLNEPQPVSEPAPGRRRITFTSDAPAGPAVATGVENAETIQEGVQKIVIDGQMFILRGEKMYDATGRLVK